MEDLKNDDIWYCYCILGKVKCSSEMLEYQQNWLRLYPILNNFLDFFASKSIRSYQDWEIIKEIDERGYRIGNTKTAKTGGTLSWNEKNNVKICSLYLEEQFEKIVELESIEIDYWDWIYDNFPAVTKYVSFDENIIYAYLNKEKNIRSPKQLPDFIFRLLTTHNPNKTEGINTEIQLAVSERATKKIGLKKVDEFVLEIGEIAKAVKIGRAKSVYKKSWISDDNSSWVAFPVESNYADKDNEKFSRDDRIKNWKVIFENKNYR